MSKIINTILTSVIAALLCFCWVRYATKNTVAAIVCSALVGAISAYVCCRLFANRQEKNNKRAANKQQIRALCDKMRYEANNADLLEPMLTYFGYQTIEKRYDEIVCRKQGKKYLVVAEFAAPKLTEETLAKHIVAAKRQNVDKLLVFCADIHPSATEACKNFDVRVVRAEELFRLFVTADKLPELPQKTRSDGGLVARFALCRARFGWYLFGALWTAAMSLVSYFKVYSLVWATILFGLALYSMFNRRYNFSSKQIDL